MMPVFPAARRAIAATVSSSASQAACRSAVPTVFSRSVTKFSAPIGGYESEQVRPKLFIPGPIEFSPEVLKANGAGARAHTDTTLIEDFGKCLEMTRKAFVTKDGQPFLVSGSGALGWDVVATNLISEGGKVLVTNTGFFCTRFENCLRQFRNDITSISAPNPGARVNIQEVEKALKDAKANGKPFEAITITHVDTSTAVLADLKEMCAMVQATSPDTLIIVDAVCSAAGEELRMDEWGVDFVLTGSQKAFGVPPGLSIMIASQKAMSRLLPKDKV
ncbi:pyridoxal phosphate-dependent transferase [Baffinella frigidus]|nr:pyridoxal phosphate-dependent transferase [Cryptophyta sp. CCMP2293]